MLVSLPSLSNIAGYNMTRAIRKKSGTGVKTNWHFVWSCSEIDKMITRTDPMIVGSFYIIRWKKEEGRRKKKCLMQKYKT